MVVTIVQHFFLSHSLIFSFFVTHVTVKGEDQNALAAISSRWPQGRGGKENKNNKGKRIYKPSWD
jgi:hypothetical protein